MNLKEQKLSGKLSDASKRTLVWKFSIYSYLWLKFKSLTNIFWLYDSISSYGLSFMALFIISIEKLSRWFWHICNNWNIYTTIQYCACGCIKNLSMLFGWHAYLKILVDNQFVLFKQIYFSYFSVMYFHYVLHNFNITLAHCCYCIVMMYSCWF